MRLTRRIAAYGFCRDEAGRVLLVRMSDRALIPGRWALPGGGIEHGEHPADAAVREVAEETGLLVDIVGLRRVRADVIIANGIASHNDRILYDVAVRGGALRDEPYGTSDQAVWCDPEELRRLPLMSFVPELLGDGPPEGGGVTAPCRPRGVPDQAGGVPDRADGVPDLPRGASDRAGGVPDRPRGVRGAAAGDGHGPRRGQRFAVYGAVTDLAGRVLLTLVADGYPGARRWHLPGGGTDHGEQPDAALLRELAEETDQAGRIIGLLGVTHHHNPAAIGPEGHPLDWHSVATVYRAAVDAPTALRVTEAAGGSTAQAGWFTMAEAADLPLTHIAAYGLQRLTGGGTMG